MAAPRVVSLIASATEIVCALGLRKSLVGRSHECDYPETVKALPRCTAPNFPVDGTSRDIDRRVKKTLRDALSVYSVDDAMLARLAPDVIVTQSQCEVCAVSLKDVEKALARRLGLKAEVVTLEPNRLADVWADIRRVARALGVPARGRGLVASLKRRMAKVSAKARRLKPKPTVACVEWIDPLMAAGNWMPELVELAGGVNLFGQAGRHSPWMKWEDLRAADPDAIFVSPCGFDLKRTHRELRFLTKRPGWARLKAARAGRVILADGNAYFNRPGPRLAESLEILAEALHPQTFRFGHEGRGWEFFRP